MASDSAKAGDKTPVEVNTDHEATIQGEPSQPARVEYDVERVEQVYKKLDRRIIPGESVKLSQWLY